MKIYVLNVVEGQEWVLPRQADDYQLFSSLCGQKQTRWHPPQMEILRQHDDGTLRHYSDFPWLGEHVLILRARALKLLRPTLEPYGEFLSLRSDQAISLCA
ncbi:hypothetical protein [Mesorhizobium sp. Root102]|uniref:hypothetical protein n=1 Tax=Mesorhizobium sp. Root102 TaxID=1736422 RepID=UPI000AF1272E|nr:hypothetical protein [Mesorhizobium sp. Root102]